MGMEVNHDRGEYNFVSTRNNNFSNRSSKWVIWVGGLRWFEYGLIFLVVGVIFGVGLFLAQMYFSKDDITMLEGLNKYCCCCLALKVKGGSKVRGKKKSKKS